MSKLKTHKAASKRFRVTKSGKLMRRSTGQDHFNSRDTGAKTLHKRRDKETAKRDERNVRSLMPYV